MKLERKMYLVTGAEMVLTDVLASEFHLLEAH